jgi:hypothetical protein
MLIGGIVEFFLGVNAAGKSLEAITKPFISTGETPRQAKPPRSPHNLDPWTGS